MDLVTAANKKLCSQPELSQGLRQLMLLTRFVAVSHERASLEHGLGQVGCGQLLLEFQVLTHFKIFKTR